MKIAILGTRGIPNNHGGFEQFAEYLSKYLVENKHEVFVYNSHSHPYQKKLWNDVNIIHCKDPEDRIGTAGQFIYDFNCIIDSRKRNFDVILQLGYTSSSIWGRLLPKKSVIITNMDGLEWKRSKYSRLVRKFLKYAEKLAIDSSNYLVADSIGIQSYLSEKYGVKSEFIAYGANQFHNPNNDIIKEYNVEAYKFNMLIARLEPENNIETILDGVVLLNSSTPFLVIGKHETNFGEYLKSKYSSNNHIRFIGGVYNLDHLNNLRYFSNIYFHGHSVGGTNPSLLEAMASNALIVANNNIFNKSILGEDAYYFKDASEISKSLSLKKNTAGDKIKNNLKKIEQQYNWDIINKKYALYISKCSFNKNIKKD